MTDKKELKTLKELTEKYMDNSKISIEELKAEAVKWLKSIHTSVHDKKEYLKQEKIRSDYGLFESNNWTNNSPLYGWIKHFFNLTEEDLKDD